LPFISLISDCLSVSLVSDCQPSLPVKNFIAYIPAYIVVLFSPVRYQKKYAIMIETAYDDEPAQAVSPVVKLIKKGEPLAACGRLACSENVVN
jgi:hypothetical protein